MDSVRNQFLTDMMIDKDKIIPLLESIINKKIEKLYNIHIFFEDNENMVVAEAFVNNEKCKIVCTAADEK